MKTIFFDVLLFLIPFAPISSAYDNKVLGDPGEKIKSAKWTTDVVTDGFTHRYFQFQNLFDAKQSVTILEVDLNKNIETDIAYVPSGFIKTSEVGEEAGAIGAINGSFFNTKVGGSTVFFKHNGRIIKADGTGLRHYRENAGFAISKSGEISIIKRPDSGWESVKKPTLLASGPLLLKEGQIIEQVAEAFNTNRHPRSAIGITKDNRLLAVVVDGRNAEAQGMSIQELSVLMQALGCQEAMNLDGGGSSTAWINGSGVVNYPSDNKLFDHAGERSVVTVLLFKKKRSFRDQ